MTEKAEKGSWLSFWMKFAFFLTVFLVVVISVLSALGGNSDVLKSSIEQYLSGTLRGPAKIEKLHQMTFYPYMSLDAEGLRVTDPKNENRTLFSADRAQMAMGFWDMTFTTGKFKTINIENLRAMPGVLIQQGLTINSAAIVDEGDQAFFITDGKIGAVPFALKVSMETLGSGSRKKYRFASIRDFTGRLGAVKAVGRVSADDPENYVIQKLEIEHNTLKIKGSGELFAGSGGRIKLKGDFTLPAGSIIKPDILFERPEKKLPKISGRIIINDAKAQDFADFSPYSALRDEIYAALHGRSEESEPFKSFGWNGILSVMAGPGEFASELIGGGSTGKMIPAMIPLDSAKGNVLAMNCAQVSLKVSKAQVTYEDIFLDMADFAMGGNMKYDAANDTMEGLLSPQLKSTSTDIKPMAVKFSGPPGRLDFDPVSVDPALLVGKSCDEVDAIRMP